MMHSIYTWLIVLLLSFPALVVAQNQPTEVDICIYGGNSAGIMAAYTAIKSGKKVLVVEPSRHLGGLTTGGLGMTDIGNKYAITGLSREYYRRIGREYGKLEQWIFEPHIASRVFQHYIDASSMSIWKGYRLKKVNKQGASIREIIVETVAAPTSEEVIKAKVFIDCSYEGDLMAASGVSYTTGRESNSEYGETINGVQLKDKHQFPDGVDPYKVPGDPSSGLLWGISADALAPAGTGDKMIQAYNFRICLTNNPDNQVAITKPVDYDASRYELLLRYLAKHPAKDLNAFLKMSMISKDKTDINNNGPFSTDMIGMNYDYPEAGYARREEIRQQHENYIRGLLYFAGHDERMPAYLRNMMLKWGYPKDEYPDNGHWSPQLYVRESRRMVGEYVMRQDNCIGKIVVPDGVGMAAYTMDSHNTQRVVVNGMVKNEGDVQVGGFGPYPIAYRSLIPRKKECTNLLVPVCLSATHIAYGSIRMEPVFMVLAQSSAVAATMAIDRKISVQDVNAKWIQAELQHNPLADGSLFEVLVDNDQTAQVTIKGDWKKTGAGSYGPSLLLDQSNGKQEKSVRFTPVIPVDGWYDIYSYLPLSAKGTSAFETMVFDSRQTKTTVIRKADLEVLGQTRGAWVSIGRAFLPKGKKAYVEINNRGADGEVIADAILFVPAKTPDGNLLQTPEDKLGWKLGSQAFTFNKFSFFETLDRLDSCGLTYVEAYPGQRIGGGIEGKMDYRMDADTRNRILRKLREKGITLQAFGVVKATTEADWKQLFEFGKAMGIQTFTAEPEKKFLPLLSALCDEYKINLALHNHPIPSAYWSPDSVQSAIRRLGPRVGACADIGHWVRSGIDPVQALKQLKGRVLHLHMKDLNEKNNKKAHDVIWGTGVSGIPDVMAELKRQQFRGMISVEYEYNWWKNVPEIIESVRFFRKTINE